MEGQLSVPEGWLVEKDEQGIESFLSPDGTSLASRRLNNSILNHTIALFCVEMISHRTILIQCGENVSTKQISEFNRGPYFKVKLRIQLVPILQDLYSYKIPI